MNKRKQIITFALSAFLVAGIMTGCGDSGKQSQETGATQASETVTEETSEESASEVTKETDSQQPVTLTIAARGGSHVDVIEAAKGEFEKEHNVKIEVLGLEAADLKQKVALDAVNKEGAYDLVMVDDPVMPEFAQNGVLLDLTENGYKDDPDFVPQSLAVGKEPYQTGDTYALPFAGNVQLFFYNKRILNSVGAKVPANWKEVLDAATKIKLTGKNGYVIRGQQGNPIVSDYLPILWAYGGNVFDEQGNVTVDSTEARQALKMYCDLLAQGANYEKNDIVSSVSSGESGMALGWPSWFISGQNAEASYAPIPTKKDADASACATGMIGNWMMGVTANSVHKEEAMQLLEYLTSKEVQEASVDKGGVPTRTSVFKNENILSRYVYFDAIYDATRQSVVRPRTPKWSSIEEVYGTELSNVVSGVKSIDRGLADAKKEIEDIMK